MPPGDILKCLLALSDYDECARELLLTRIKNHQYDGHTAGNILLLGLEKVFKDYLLALDAFEQILLKRGKVIPITTEQSELCAEYSDGSQHEGEVNVDQGIKEGKTISRLFLKPQVHLLEQAQKAIEVADAFCIGPGSLYTSLLANFLPEGITESLRNAKGKFFYIANLLTEGKGMKGMSLEHIVGIVERYIGRRVNYIVTNKHQLADDNPLRARYAAEEKYPIVTELTNHDERYVFADLWLDHTIARHDSAQLGYLISSLI